MKKKQAFDDFLELYGDLNYKMRTKKMGLEEFIHAAQEMVQKLRECEVSILNPEEFCQE